MIEKLELKNYLDVITFLNDTVDKFEDFYFTVDKKRLFIKNNEYLVKKLLKNQECYGYFDKGLKGILVIYRTKGYRPYLKIFTLDYTSTTSLMKFFVWNKNDIDIFCKFKQNNPVVNVIVKFGFYLKGNRDKEALFFKKGFKNLYKVAAKDDYLPEQENRLY